MMIYDALSVIFFCVALALSATLFILVSASLGRVCLAALRQQISTTAFAACLGVTPILVVLWYFQQTGVALWLIRLWWALGAIALVKVMLVPVLQGDAKMRATINQVGITALLIGLVFGCFGGLQQPATFGNNDLYNWYASASTLIGKARYSEMSPDAPGAFAGLIIDAFGTNWMLALVGLGYDEPVRSATLFLVVASCWLALTLQWHLRSFFGLGPITSILASVVPMSSSLFIYLSFNSFFAQLLGSIGCALLIAAAIHIHAKESDSLFTRVVMVLVPVLWTLCVYQSGFVVFQFIAVSFAFFLFSSSGPIRGSKAFASHFLLPYVIALLVCVAVIPSVLGHLIDRTRTVSDIVAGWPLPLFPAHVFLGLPWPDASNMWLVSGAEGGHVWGYLYFVFGIVVLLALHRLYSSTENWRSLVMVWIWYALLVATYLVWFHTGKTQYQNWKFAAFFIFPISSLPLGTLISVGKQYFALYDSKARSSCTSASIVGVGVAMALAIALTVNIPTLYRRAERVGATVDEFSRLRDMIKPGMGLTLDLGDYGPSMLGMLMFSRTVSTYPIGQTYLPPATQFGTEPRRGLLTSAACDKLFSQLGYTTRDTELARTENFVVSSTVDTNRFGYRFEAGGGPCGWGRKTQLDSGFSVSESWGRWTEGERAQITIGLPTNLMNRAIRADLLIQPYVPVGRDGQHIKMSINGTRVLATTLDSRRVVSIDIPADLPVKGELVISLDLPDAVSPSMMESGNKDARKLGIGFIGLGIRAIDIKGK